MRRSSGGAEQRHARWARGVRSWALGIGLAAGAAAAQAQVWEAGVGVGYRVDRFSWNIAGDIDGENPNVLSELTWSDMQIAEIRADAAIWPRNGAWGIVADGHYGVIVDGDNQDSDYAGDFRTFEFMRSRSKGDGEVGSANLGLAYRKRVYDTSAERHALITAALGYGMHSQWLNIKDGRQVIPTDEPLDGLNSRYDAEWEGPWASIVIAMELNEQTTLDLGFRFDDLDYEAEADWNLRDDFAHPVSFRQYSSGTGLTATLGMTRRVSSRWSVQGALQYKDWSAEDGLDRVYGADGTILDTRFNGADWQSLGAWVQTRYRY